MKNFTLFMLFLVSTVGAAFGQTATGTITQQPCNNDGIYTVTTTGIPLPITYTYYVNGTSIVHANVNSATDQLTNIAMSSDGYLFCQATGGGLTAYSQDSYTPSFYFATSASPAICPSTTGTLTATQVNGTPGPFSYVWTNTQTAVTYTGNNVSAPVGDYSAEITDLTTGCVLTVGDTTATIYPESGIVVSISTTPASCTNGSATAVASGTVAPYTYQWSNGVTTAANTGLSQGYYGLVVTDAQGCQTYNQGAYIQQNPTISVNTTITNATCVQTNGSAIAFGAGGVGPYTYAWSNGQAGQTATGLSGNTYYTVVATDANGCVGQGSAYINASTPITVTYASTPSQCTAATGSATLTPTGGTAPYSYSWVSNAGVTGNAITNVSPGTYAFQVTDAAGCIRTGAAVVPPVSSIFANISTPTVVCPATTGTLTALASGSNGPFTYLWSNGATTSAITASLGNYSCVITDALGCSVTKYGGLIVDSPVNAGVMTTPVTCMYNTDGAAATLATGGTAPYTYFYSNGTTTASATGLGMGGYTVHVTDANGCTGYQYFSITNANTSQDCYCTISGDVYVDANANCVNDPGETGVENIMIHCSGFGYAFTNASGHYSFKVPTGTYTISENINQYYPLAACQNNTNTVSVVAASGCNTVVDFANVINPLHDLKIVTVNSTVPPIPGNGYLQKVIVRNEGTITESGIQLGYEHDGQLSFVSSSLPALTQLDAVNFPDWYSVQSGFPTLNPNGETVMLLNYATPTTIPLGTSVEVFDSVAHAAPIATNWLLDNSPWNNVNTFHTNVIGAYDPNYKEVTPRGEGPAGSVPMETLEFDYTIHFQNEGTYYAQNIVVTDQLDDDFDWTTFKPGYSEYEYTTTMSETGLVTFTFADINLPWKSQFGDVLSSALVHYSIQRKPTATEGTEFTNTANIYFDYNAPITTNTTLNTLEVLGVDEVASGNGTGITVDLYPVPASDYLAIRVNNVAKGGTATVSIVDLAGKVVLTNDVELGEGSTTVTRQLDGLMNGTYLTRIVFENGSAITKKVVVYNN